MGVMGEPEVVEMRVREHDDRDIGRGWVVREHTGYVRQDVLAGQLGLGALRRAAREVAAVRRHKLHAQVEKVPGAVVSRHLDAPAADLMPTAVHRVPQVRAHAGGRRQTVRSP